MATQADRTAALRSDIEGIEKEIATYGPRLDDLERKLDRLIALLQQAVRLEWTDG